MIWQTASWSSQSRSDFHNINSGEGWLVDGEEVLGSHDIFSDPLIATMPTTVTNCLSKPKATLIGPDRLVGRRFGITLNTLLTHPINPNIFILPFSLSLSSPAPVAAIISFDWVHLGEVPFPFRLRVGVAFNFHSSLLAFLAQLLPKPLFPPHFPSLRVRQKVPQKNKPFSTSIEGCSWDKAQTPSSVHQRSLSVSAWKSSWYSCTVRT